MQSTGSHLKIKCEYSSGRDGIIIEHLEWPVKAQLSAIQQLSGQGNACCPRRVQVNVLYNKTILNSKVSRSLSNQRVKTSCRTRNESSKIQRIWYNTRATTTPPQSTSLFKLGGVDPRQYHLQPQFGQQLKLGYRHCQRVGDPPAKAVVPVDKSNIHPPSCLMKDDWNLGQNPADGTT